MPTYSPKLIDPGAGPVTLQLTPHDLDRRDPELILRGRVIDEDGKPVAGATIAPIGFMLGNSGQFGGLKGVDALAVTNGKGEFRLGVSHKEARWYLQVAARFFAPQRPTPITAGPKVNEIKLHPGVSVSGKVVKDGKPLAGVALGLVQQNRSAEQFVGEFKISTDADGHFMFSNVPAKESYFIYGLMESCMPHGAIAAQKLTVRQDGTTKDVGTLALQQGHHLSGRIMLSDDKAVPANTRVLLSREEAWDTQTAVAAADGTFSFIGLPTERYRMTTNIRDYRISPRNHSYDLLNSSLVGVVDVDITGLTLLLEPGPRLRPDISKLRKEDFEEQERRQKGPLRGVAANKGEKP